MVKSRFWMSIVFIFALVACTSPKTNSRPTGAEPKLTVDANPTEFREGEIATFIIKIESPADASVSIKAVSSRFVELTDGNRTVEVKANVPNTVSVSGRILRGGYHTLTLEASSPAWNKSIADMYGFNAVPSTPSAAGLGVAAMSNKPGEEALSDHLNNLPVVSDFSLYFQQVKAELEGRKDVRLDFAMKDAVVTDIKGNKVKLDNQIVNYEPGTGSGRPASKNGNYIQPQETCGPITVTAHFDIVDPQTGLVLNLQNNKVFAYNRRFGQDGANHQLPPILLTQSYLDANGNITFQQPCGADLYLQVQSFKPFNPAVDPGNGVITYYTQALMTYVYAVTTGTYFGNTQSQINVRLQNNSSATTNALWVQNLLWQTGVAYLQQSGLTPVPVKIFWPGVLVNNGYDAYSPISRIVLGSARWPTTSPVVHEYGHNIKYYWDDRNKFNCALNSAVLVAVASGCLDPDFADTSALNGGYQHYAANSYGQPIGMNEGWANAFYEVVALKFGTSLVVDDPGVYPQASRCNKTPTCYSYGPSYVEAAYGPGNELRVSTFLYRYTTEILACNNPNNVLNAYKRLTETLGKTRAGIYELWNNYLYRSFPADNNSSCIGDVDRNGVLNQDDYRYKLRSIFQDTTLMRPDGTGFSGEWVKIP